MSTSPASATTSGFKLSAGLSRACVEIGVARKPTPEKVTSSAPSAGRPSWACRRRAWTTSRPTSTTTRGVHASVLFLESRPRRTDEPAPAQSGATSSPTATCPWPTRRTRATRPSPGPWWRRRGCSSGPTPHTSSGPHILVRRRHRVRALREFPDQLPNTKRINFIANTQRGALRAADEGGGGAARRTGGGAAPRGARAPQNASVDVTVTPAAAISASKSAAAFSKETTGLVASLRSTRLDRGVPAGHAATMSRTL